MNILLAIIVGAIIIIGVGALLLNSSTFQRSNFGIPTPTTQMQPSLNPSSSQQQTVWVVITSSSNYRTFVQAVQLAELQQTLEANGPYTVFVPSDAAFSRIPSSTINTVLQNKSQLTMLLKYHIVQGRYTLNDLKSKTTLPTLEGKNLSIEQSGNDVLVNNIHIVSPNNEANNGVVHVIDGVLIPP
ncbi:fasciclin domain-containing protein [Candidatus Roizmanbacteria bacterium]|nr:fasciclin domain-containing protein [Candidatus Roizmanbacteria bacterium]